MVTRPCTRRRSRALWQCLRSARFHHPGDECWRATTRLLVRRGGDASASRASCVLGTRPSPAPLLDVKPNSLNPSLNRPPRRRVEAQYILSHLRSRVSAPARSPEWPASSMLVEFNLDHTCTIAPAPLLCGRFAETDDPAPACSTSRKSITRVLCWRPCVAGVYCLCSSYLGRFVGSESTCTPPGRPQRSRCSQITHTHT